MHVNIRRPLTICVGITLLWSSACGSDGASAPNRNGDYEGVAVSEMPLLAAGCSITSGVMTVTVKDGESALIALRPTDSVVTVNGHIFSGTTDSGNPCEIPSTGTMIILADSGSGAMHTLGRSIILDYLNGLFMLGTSTAPGIRIDLTLTGDTGALNWLKVRGSDGVDNLAIGAGTTTGYASLNVNARTTATSAATQVGGTGGVTVALDNIADVNFKVVGNVMMSVGLGDDRIDGTTGVGIGTAYAAPLQLFGGDGADTLIGGNGADTISGGAMADTMSGCAGNDTYDMGAAAAGADIITQICPVTPALTSEGADTVDYHARTVALAVNLSHTLTNTTPAMDTTLSGESSGDGAHISDKIANVTLGAGDDAITIGTSSTTVHKVFGGPGDDTFTGGLATDIFDGQAGDDTCVGNGSIMDYHLRSTALAVSICNGTSVACGTTAATDANDGELSVTRTGTGAATVAPGSTGTNLVTITGTGFTSASVGNMLTLSGCVDSSAAAVTAENGSYKIVRYVSGTVVKIDVGSSTVFAAATDTCNYSEAKPDGTTNPSTSVAASTMTVKHMSGTVTGLNHATNWGAGDTLTLTHTVGSGVTDDGPYPVVKSLGATSVAIDETAVSTFTGGITAMTWSDAGPEHDNVQCTQVLGGTAGDVITGDNRNNILHGGDGADTLSGGAGNDALYGEANADTLYGGANDDTLVGGGATGTDLGDQLIGGDGNDILEGDDGADMFQCNGKNRALDSAVGTAPGDSDITVDFTPSTDTGPGGSSTLTDCRF
jgi:Ca2+-binding RTX toxin-like protein